MFYSKFEDNPMKSVAIEIAKKLESKNKKALSPSGIKALQLSCFYFSNESQYNFETMKDSIKASIFEIKGFNKIKVCWEQIKTQNDFLSILESITAAWSTKSDDYEYRLETLNAELEKDGLKFRIKKHPDCSTISIIYHAGISVNEFCVKYDADHDKMLKEYEAGFFDTFADTIIRHRVNLIIPKDIKNQYVKIGKVKRSNIVKIAGIEIEFEFDVCDTCAIEKVCTGLRILNKNFGPQEVTQM